MAMRLVYLCIRKGLPSAAAQRAALLAAGITEEDLAEAYIDKGKPRAGQPDRQERDYIIGAAREGDEVWVARCGVLAATLADAQGFLAAISDHGAILCDAATGQRFHVPSAVADQVSDALRFAREMHRDERAAALEKARAKRGRPAGKPAINADRMEAARVHWFNHDISGDEAARRTGIGKRTLHRYFGKRETPAFGAALNKMRDKK
jgi:DNA invertase Pin-like site-specific DNA recombinase